MPKTIMITGSTDGLGLAAAKLFADQGHTVVMHGRSANKLEAALAQVPGAKGYLADMSDLTQVRDLADAVMLDHTQIDVLINNAGVYKMPNPVLASGMDARFVVNTTAPFLLTSALLPSIPKGGGSSTYHRQHKQLLNWLLCAVKSSLKILTLMRNPSLV